MPPMSDSFMEVYMMSFLPPAAGAAGAAAFLSPPPHPASRILNNMAMATNRILFLLISQKPSL